ncbi:hypothetical protein [Psychrobacillus sp. NPDC096623]|uniref:hypothetical protein n=1 Tax=Psychrobacillus sp. NPDC096623 TaxID=3364492 RepID=UPI00380831CB
MPELFNRVDELGVTYVFEGETEFDTCRDQLASFIRHVCVNEKTTSFNISEVYQNFDENGKGFLER